MARNIKPGNPVAVNPVNVKIPDIDLSLFDQLGDMKVKSAMQNFDLYAQTKINLESQKLYEQYKNNPLALAEAMEKLPEILSDLPQSVQDKYLPKIQTTAFSLVGKAKANQQAMINKQNKLMAHANVDLLNKQLADDSFNMLTYLTAPDEEKRPLDRDNYNFHRNSLAQLTSLTDDDGDPLFTDAQRAKMIMPKEAFLAGFQEFIYRPELAQLEQWDKDIFQNRDKFMQETGIDADVYDSAEKMLTSRIRQLKDDKTRKVKAQAMFEVADVIKNGNDEVKIDALRKNTNAPKRLIDKAVKLNEESIKAHWYDPNRDTDPTGMYNIISVMGDIANDPDNTPDGIERKLNLTVDALDSLNKNARTYNMSDDDLQTLTNWIADTVTNKTFAQNVQMLDLSPWINNIKQDMIMNPASYKQGAYETFNEELQSYEQAGKVHPEVRKAAKIGTTDVVGSTQHGVIKRNRARSLAYDKAKSGIFDIINYLREGGDIQTAKQMLNQVKYDYVKTYNSDWIAGSEFDRLQSELEQGKKPIYFHNGVTWEYNGYQNDGSIFKVRF